MDWGRDLPPFYLFTACTRGRLLGFSDYLYDNAFVDAFLYEKKNGYFSFFLFSKERIRILSKQCIPPWFLLARRIAVSHFGTNQNAQNRQGSHIICSTQFCACK
jgi:hypothetical protein